MDLETWTARRVDTLRLKRLVVGSVIGCITVTATLAFVILSSKGAQAFEEEEEGPIEVSLASEPEPEPPPPAPADAPKPAPRPKVASPLEVPDDKPEEKDPTPAQLEPPAEIEEVDEAPVAAVASSAPAAPPPPPKPKPVVRKAVRLTEDMPKPVVIEMNTPSYPPDAKNAGIEGVVIVKYLVGEDGRVRDAKVLKGPPELRETCLATVKTWRFQPLTVDGSPISFVKIARFPFRIR
jgi:protein TonB